VLQYTAQGQRCNHALLVAKRRPVKSHKRTSFNEQVLLVSQTQHRKPRTRARAMCMRHAVVLELERVVRGCGWLHIFRLFDLEELDGGD
jgi:hypothetical protein